MNTAYLGLGSNVDAKRHIKIAVHAIIRSFEDAEFSPIYRSNAVGFEGEDFLNLVARIQTELKPAELREYLRGLEASHGRNHDAPKWSDRTLDIDILLYNDLVIDSGSLKLPRAEILHFAHVLKPLADIAPDLRHPVAKLTYSELWKKGDWIAADLFLVDPDFLGKRLRLV
ncbi:MAG: 2-amino-4-hydroxy-6-hydroxymethyldihydropteridine diphosphokinase [Lysobacterales bacterium]